MQRLDLTDNSSYRMESSHKAVRTTKEWRLYVIPKMLSVPGRIFTFLALGLLVLLLIGPVTGCTPAPEDTDNDTAVTDTDTDTAVTDTDTDADNHDADVEDGNGDGDNGEVDDDDGEDKEDEAEEKDDA